MANGLTLVSQHALTKKGSTGLSERFKQKGATLVKGASNHL